MAKIHSITYTRGTTYSLTHNYTGPALGATLYFVVKNVANDSDAADTANSLFAPKVVTMTGSTFPQTTAVTINPSDVALTKLPGTYYYSLKVKDVNGHEYLCDSGQFILEAVTVNET